MAIVTARGKRAIEDHFDNAYELESQLSGTSKESYLMIDRSLRTIKGAKNIFTIPLQLLSYHVALIKGTDIDKPRNLAKSVTVE
jgi:glucosamine 6-phosphate synthetase-like amidotransferase/phosphosugar isomerase protein